MKEIHGDPLSQSRQHCNVVQNVRIPARRRSVRRPGPGTHRRVPPARHVYRYHRAAVAKRPETTANPPLSQRYGPNSALTIAEEHRLISWIMERQRAQDCPSPRAVREYAAEIRATSRGLQRAPDEHLSRDWWYSFKQRHSAEIGVQIAVSREASRTRITRDTVEAYFAQMREVTANLETPMQLINMDETGFHARLDRNRRRKCVFHKQCQTHSARRQAAQDFHSWLPSQEMGEC